MSRINCHSGFQHYEMFHSRHCGGNNYGSIFNTTYNIKCGGSHTGGFWGGFGIGLGNAFGGWLGGILGGGNMFGGNMFGGFPMFGGGMFSGFPSWNNSWNFSDMWGNREKKADKSDESDKPEKSSKSESNSKAAECKDPDRKKLNEYGAKVNTLVAKSDNEIKPDDIKTLYDNIKAAQEDSKTEGHHDDTDPEAYQQWLNILKTKANGLGYGDIESEDFGKAKDPAAPAQAAPAPVAQPEVVAPATEEPPVVENSDVETDERLKQLENFKLPSGYKAPDETTDYSKLVLVTDHSEKTQDVKPKTSDGVTVAAEKVGKFPKQISVITAKANSFDYEYIGMVDNCPIYASKNDTNKNIYIACIDSNNQLVFHQFTTNFSGYGLKDNQNEQ